MGAPLTLPKGGTFAGCEGLVMRVCGDGQPYTITLTTGRLIAYCVCVCGGGGGMMGYTCQE